MGVRHQFVHLDFARGLAAFLVFGGHLRAFVFVDYGESSDSGLAEVLFYFLTGLSHEAVMVFFVLSGFLISKTVFEEMEGGSWSWGRYLAKRLSRLWMVLIPALLLTAFWDESGRLLGDPALYEGEYRALFQSGPVPGTQGASWSLGTFVQNTVYLQTITAPTFGSNTPLWSLANEFWYYLLFPLACSLFLGRVGAGARLTTACLLGVSLIFIPVGIWILGTVWLFGVGAMLISRESRFQRFLASRVSLVCAGLSFFAALMVARGHLVPEISGQILVGAGFAVLVPCLLHCRPSNGLYAGMARFLAATSYTLYLAHFPFMAFLVALSISGEQYPWSVVGILVFFAMACLTLVYSYLIYRLFEARTEVVRTWMLTLAAGR